MRKISSSHYAYATVSPLELNEMTGGFMMGLIMKFSVPALQHDGRRDETMRTGAGYVDPSDNIAPRRRS